MSDPPKGNPNPNYARLMKIEKGKPTTPVTVTPLEMPVEGEEHWIDLNHHKLVAVVENMGRRGIDLTRWLEGRALASTVSAPSFALDFAAAAIVLVEQVEARIAKLEGSGPKD